MAMAVPRSVCAKMVPNVIMLMENANVPRDGKDDFVINVSDF